MTVRIRYDPWLSTRRPRIETHDSVRVEFESTMAVPTARIRGRCRTHRATRVQIPKGTWTGLAEALAGIGRAHRGGAAGSRCHPDRQHAPPRAAHVDDPARGRSASPRSTLGSGATAHDRPPGAGRGRARLRHILQFQRIPVGAPGVGAPSALLSCGAHNLAYQPSGVPGVPSAA